jgi:hypothetical protein
MHESAKMAESAKCPSLQAQLDETCARDLTIPSTGEAHTGIIGRQHASPLTPRDQLQWMSASSRSY